MQIHHLAFSSKVPTDHFSSQFSLIYESFLCKQDAAAMSFSSQFHWVELLWKKAAKPESQLTEFAIYPPKRMKIFKQKIKRKACNSDVMLECNHLIWI